MKKFYPAIIAALFALGSAFAFRQDPTWYFTGDSAIATERTTPSLYNTMLVTCGASLNKLCSIVAPDNSGLPTISGQLHTDLHNGGASAPNYNNADIKGKM